MEVYYHKHRVGKMVPGVGKTDPAEDIYVPGSNPCMIRIKPYARVLPCTREEMTRARKDWRAYQTIELPSEFLERLVVQIGQVDYAQKIFGDWSKPPLEEVLLGESLAEAGKLIGKQTRLPYSKKRPNPFTQAE